MLVEDEDFTGKTLFHIVGPVVLQLWSRLKPVDRNICQIVYEVVLVFELPSSYYFFATTDYCRI